MEFSKYRFWAILLFVLGTVVIYCLFINLSDHEITVANAFTLFGTYFSLYGLVVAYLQIQSIKGISTETKDAVDASAKKVNQIISVSELSKSNKVVQEIQIYLQDNKFELALVRMKDLKAILIQIQYNEHLADYVNDKLYNVNITDLATDMNNLYDHMTGGKKGINFSKLNQNMENLSTTLSQFENQLKYKKYDT